LRVADTMRARVYLPVVHAQTPFRDIMQAMTRGGLGVAIGLDAAGRAQSIFTDGDLRRLLEGMGAQGDRRHLTGADVLRPGPHCIAPEALAAAALQRMEAARVTCLLVTDTVGQLLGALNTNDLLRAGVF